MAAEMEPATVPSGDFDSQGDPPGGCLVAAEYGLFCLTRLTPAGVGGFLVQKSSKIKQNRCQNH